MVLVGATLLIYFIPWIVASRRNYPHAEAIGFLNFALWWTFLGWVACMAWACMYTAGGNCWQCNGRLNGFPSVCQFCGAKQQWTQPPVSAMPARKPPPPKPPTPLNIDDPDAWKRAADPVYAAEVAEREKRQAVPCKSVKQTDTAVDEAVANMMSNRPQ